MTSFDSNSPDKRSMMLSVVWDGLRACSAAARCCRLARCHCSCCPRCCWGCACWLRPCCRSLPHCRTASAAASAAVLPGSG